MALLRCVLGFFFVIAFGFFYGISMRMRFKELPRLLIIAILYLAHTIGLNIGTNLTSASHSTILVSLYPLFAVIFAHFWIKDDKLTLPKLIGIIIAFGGVFITVLPKLQSGSGATSLIGDFIVMLSGAIVGLRMTFTKIYLQEIHPYRLLIWLLSFSIPCLLLLGYFFEGDETIKLSIPVVVAVIYQGWIVAGVLLVSWTSLLRKYKASKIIVFFFLMPISGVVFSYLLLGDELSIYVLAGTALVAVGIYLVNMRRKEIL
ncbi:DMT family transporter [Candidatus Poribacteria bacterium]|nr:DMT family transporter [Candidatus Poribacteria bacterium]